MPETIAERVEKLLKQLTLTEKVSLLSGKDLWRTVPIERPLDGAPHGIPSLVMTDGPHGVRANRDGSGRSASPATSYPTGIAMASTWDPELIYKVGIALGEETRHLGCDILLGPCVNIVRSPLGGRNFETYSEDPYLAGRIGVAFIQGVQSQSIGTSLKHFACNNQEIDRHRGNSVVDERTLREIYLPAFEAAVKEAQPWTVMNSYNKVNGTYAGENPHLLTEILRQEWGFAGAVISDWGATHSISQAVKAGMDLEMPGPARYFGHLLEAAVHNWQLDEAVIDQAVRRILRMVILSGKLDPDRRLPAGSGDTPAHRALARLVAEESIVLLKNEGGLLPIDPAKVKSIAVIGPNAAEARYGGGGSSFLEPPYAVSPLEGLKARFGSQVMIDYAPGCSNQVTPPFFGKTSFIPAHGSGNGLTVEFFDNPDLAGAPAATRTDNGLEYFWFGSGPETGINKDSFSIRWTGKLVSPGAGHYTLLFSNTHSARLYLDGRLLADNNPGAIPVGDFEKDPTRLMAQAPFDFEAGRTYELKIEFRKTAPSLFGCLRLQYSAPTDPEAEIRRAVELARRSDLAIIFAGLPTFFESEGNDRPDMDLPGPQTALIRAVAAANPNTVVVVNAGAPVTLPWLEAVPAALDAFYPGQEGGHAIASILSGDVNPSGKLTITFPKRLQDNPAYINYPGSQDVLYGEGIYVGYRYYDKKDIEPRFPFGFGLSYTTFAYHDLHVPATVASGESFEVSVKVANTGQSAGKEVVQLYVSDPKSSLGRPPKELKGFKKVALQPGESQVVTFTLDPRALSFYNPYTGRWTAEPGAFEIRVGSSAGDIRATAGFELK